MIFYFKKFFFKRNKVPCNCSFNWLPWTSPLNPTSFIILPFIVRLSDRNHQLFVLFVSLPVSEVGTLNYTAQWRYSQYILYNMYMQGRGFTFTKKSEQYKMKTVTVLSSLAFLILWQLRREVLKTLNYCCQIRWQNTFFFFSSITEIGYWSHMMCIGLNICLFLSLHLCTFISLCRQ